MAMGKDGAVMPPLEHLVVYVVVKMFYQLSVRESGVGLQGHKGNLCGRTENVPASQTLHRQVRDFCHTAKGNIE